VHQLASLSLFFFFPTSKNIHLALNVAVRFASDSQA
jgi:hypothetical protein